MAVLEVSAVIGHAHVDAAVRELRTSAEIVNLKIDVVIDQPHVSVDTPPAV